MTGVYDTTPTNPNLPRSLPVEGPSSGCTLCQTFVTHLLSAMPTNPNLSTSMCFYEEYRGRKTTPVWLFRKMDYSASVSSLSSSRARMDREMRLFSESTSVIFTFTV